MNNKEVKNGTPDFHRNDNYELDTYRCSYSAWSYGGATAGGSHGPVTNSWRSASSLVRPHLAAVDR